MPTTSPIRGPGVFLAQFAGDAAPYDTLDGLAGWAAGHGYAGVQIPTWDTRLIDLALAADSQTYCDDLCSRLADHGLQITELSTHLQGQLVAVHPAYDAPMDAFAPEAVRGRRANPVVGVLTPAEALRQMVGGTGLTVTPVGARTFSVTLARADAGAEDVTAIEDVIVTAQKRAQRIQDVPLSVTVLSGEDARRQALPAQPRRDLPAERAVRQGRCRLREAARRRRAHRGPRLPQPDGAVPQ